MSITSEEVGLFEGRPSMVLMDRWIVFFMVKLGW